MYQGQIEKFWKTVYDDATPPAGGDTPPAGGDTPPAGGGGDDGNTPPAGGESFTQDQLNTILRKDRLKHKEQLDKALGEINALKAKSQFTTKEKAELESRIEELRKANMTKEELQKEERERVRKELQEKLDAITQEKDSWQTRYTEAAITRSITDAASSHDAFSPAQIVAILKPNTRLTEALDDKGEPTGELTPIVTFNDMKDGKAVTLELAPNEAVKRMTEIDTFLNLFKGKGTGGIGGTNRPGGKGKLTLAEAAKLSPAEYNKWVKENGLE